MNRAQRRHVARQVRRGVAPVSTGPELPNLKHMAGMAILPIAPGISVDSSLRVRSAYEALRDGTGDDGDFQTLAGALNVALVRAEQIHELAEMAIIEAQHALMRCLARHLRGQRYGFDHTGLANIPPALNLYDDILASSTPAQMQEALQEAARRMQAGQVLEVQRHA